MPTFLVDGKGLVPGDDLVFADVAEFRRAVVVVSFHLHDFVVESVFVGVGRVRLLHELGGVLVHVFDGQVYGHAAKTQWLVLSYFLRL